MPTRQPTPDGQPLGTIYNGPMYTGQGGLGEYKAAAQMDPTFLAYQQAAQAGDSIARAEAARSAGIAQAGMAQLPGEYADTLAQHLRSISDKFENNGMWSSSNRLTSQNQEQGALEGQMLAQRNAFQNQIGSANADLAKQLANGQMNLAQQEGAGANRALLGAASTGLDLTNFGPRGQESFYAK